MVLYFCEFMSPGGRECELPTWDPLPPDKTTLLHAIGFRTRGGCQGLEVRQFGLGCVKLSALCPALPCLKFQSLKPGVGYSPAPSLPKPSSCSFSLLHLAVLLRLIFCGTSLPGPHLFPQLSGMLFRTIVKWDRDLETFVVYKPAMPYRLQIFRRSLPGRKQSEGFLPRNHKAEGTRWISPFPVRPNRISRYPSAKHL